MLRLPDERVWVVVRGVPGDWASACAGFEGEILKDHGRGTVWAGEMLGRAVVCKCLRLDTLRRRVQARLGLSQARRHWRAAGWLRDHGIATAERLAIVRGRRGGERVECLVMERVAGPTALEVVAGSGLPARQRLRLAEAVGRLAGQMAAAGRLNRDAKPSNLIVTGLGDGSASLAVIDCGDLRPCGREDVHAAARMLASAVIEPMGCGCAVSRASCAAGVGAAAAALGVPDRRGFARELWREAARLVERHGDPTPEINPLRAGEDVGGNGGRVG